MKRRFDLWASLLPIAVAGILLALAPRLPWLAPLGQPSPGLLLQLLAAGVAGASHRPLKGETLGLGTMVLPSALLLSSAAAAGMRARDSAESAVTVGVPVSLEGGTGVAVQPSEGRA